MANRSRGNWNPNAEPYRVRKIRRSFAPGCHGWADSVATYATLDEAMAAMDARMTGGEFEYQLDLAKIEDGKHTAWVELANRKFRKQLKKTKHFPKNQLKA
jgi:hypothetical protein